VRLHAACQRRLRIPSAAASFSLPALVLLCSTGQAVPFTRHWQLQSQQQAWRRCRCSSATCSASDGQKKRRRTQLYATQQGHEKHACTSDHQTTETISPPDDKAWPASPKARNPMFVPSNIHPALYKRTPRARRRLRVQVLVLTPNPFLKLKHPLLNCPAPLLCKPS
jgi:hypothetical protein